MSRVYRLFVAVAVCAAAGFAAVAEIPAGYYDGIEGLTTSALKTKLHEIIRNHSTNSYNGLFSKSFIYTDVREDGTWWDMYSDIDRYVRVNGRVDWDGMNREHSFPKSWWGGATNVPEYTDLNHLYPADGDANMKKSNYPLGEVDPSGVTFDNGVSTVGRPVSGQGGGATRVFEPADEYKGDFARTYFYMVTCYQDDTWKYQYMAAQGTYPTLQGWAIDLLLEWHREDPVSQKEIDRNDAVFGLQSNRNPFIDFPEIAEYIWGDMKGQPFVSGELPPIGEGVLVTPQNNSTVDFGSVVKGKTSTVTLPIKGTVTADLSLTVTGTSDFSIPVKSVDWREINSNEGYNLEIKYTPKSIGASEAMLLLFDGGLQGVTSYSITLRGNAVEMPVFDRPVATEATNLSPAGFRANWITPSNPEVIDYYIVNFSEYVNGSRRDFSLSTDDDTPYLDFNEAVSGANYSYTVQSVRYGEKSQESNVVNVSLSAGISELNGGGKGFSAFSTGGGVKIECNARQTGIKVCNLQGVNVITIPELDGATTVALQPGAYLIYSDQCRRPVKVMAGF